MSRTSEKQAVSRAHAAEATPRAPTPHRHSWSAVPAAEGILRPRLLRRLDDVLAVRLATVVGPAGSGKTTAMAQWARRAPVDVAWYRAVTADGHPDTLLERLAETVEQVSAHRPPARLDGLLHLLDQRDSPLVLVIDDLHLIAHPDVVDLLQRLLTSMPPHVHVLTGSRRPPPFNLAQSELTATVVGTADLRFRSPEVDRLFRTTYDAPLDQTDCLRLTRHTEGWAAALHLFHLQVTAQPPDERHRAVRGLAGQVRYAREYVGREILAPLPHELVDLLRTTSVLESLTGRRCDLLLGTTHSQRRLLELERRGVLTASTTGSGSFRLPTVLRAHLATQLRDELGDQATEAWLCDAARVTTVEPGPDRAAETVRLYAAAGAWRQVLDIMERQGPQVLVSPDLDWVDAAPPGLRRDETWLRLVEAARAVRDGRFEVAARYAAIPEETETTPQAQRLGRALARMARQWTVGDLEPDGSWFEGLRAELRRPAPQPRGMAGSPEQALLRSIGLALSGDVRAARQRLEGSLVSLHGDPLASLTGQLLAELLGPSDSAGAEALADRAESLGMPWFARMGHGLAAALDDGGHDSVSSLILDSENRGDAWGALLLAGIRCVTSLRAGRVDPGHFDDLVARCRTMDCPALEAWARAGLALAAAAANLPDAAREGRSAEGYARCAAVPGAVAVSYGALAVSAVDESSELRVLAETEAEAVGLDCRPWTWVAAADPALPSRLHAADVPAVAIRCFGGFELRVAGDAPPLTRVRPKARALLRLLALNAGRPVHRETLIDALWPDLDIAAGTHNLQVYVSSLRTLLEPGVLRGASRLVVRDGDRYTLRLPEPSSCDVQEFEIATAEAERSRALGDLDAAVVALEKAMLLYAGDLLPEDGPAEWVTGPRDHYRIRAAEAGAALAELLLARDLPDRAAAAALRSIDIEPCRDGSWRLLLAAYGASGDLAAAERTRRSYAEVLASLGVVSEQAQAVRPGRATGH